MKYKAEIVNQRGLRIVDKPLVKVDKCRNAVNYVNRNVNQKQAVRLTPIVKRHKVLNPLSTLSTIFYIKEYNSKNVVYTYTYHAYFTRAREDIAYKSFRKIRLTVDKVKNENKTSLQMTDIRRSIRRLARRATTSEKAIEAYLIRKVEEAGGLCLKFSSHTQVGYPDRLLLMPGGRTAWVELKSKGEKPRRIQGVRIEKLKELGFNVYVADSREMIDNILQNYGL